MKSSTTHTLTLALILTLALTPIPSTAMFPPTTPSCPLGTIPNPTNKTLCTPCPPGTASDNPHLGCTPCPPTTINPHPSLPSTSLCTACPPSTTPSLSKTFCRRCPPGYTARSFARCMRCPPGTYAAPNRCLRCPSTTYSSEYNARACTPCPAGLFPTRRHDGCIRRKCREGRAWDIWLDETTWRYRAGCRECPGVSARPRWRERCVACGDRETVAGADDKKKCIRCPPGSYLTNIHPPSPFNDVDARRCAPCPGNSTTVGYSKPVCRLRAVGGSGAAAASAGGGAGGGGCPPKTFVDFEGDCQTCPRNTRYAPLRRRCVKCGPGEVSGGGLNTKCRKCPSNTIVFNGRCDCSAGHIFVNGRCIPCPPGTFRTPEGSDFLLDNQCHACGDGEYSKRGSARCTRCAEGWSSVRDGGKICRGGVVCGKGEVLPRGEENMYSRWGVCVVASTGCPRGLENAQRVGAIACRNATTGEFPCTKDRLYTGERSGNPCTLCPWGVAVRVGGEGEGRQAVYRCKSCGFDEVRKGGLFGECVRCGEGRRPDHSGLNKCICAEGHYMLKGKCTQCPEAGTRWLPTPCLFQALL